MAETSLVIFVNLLKCLFAFYSLYYIVSSICYGAFRLHNFDGKIPFNFAAWVDYSKCCQSYSKEQIVNVISMEVTFFLTSWAFVIFLRTRFWDYAITVTSIHFTMSCIVMLDFPLNWSWWASLVIGMLMMMTIGEVFCYLCYELRPMKSRVDPTNEVT
ncbi:putative transmembrane protein 244 [Lineus longissimus]|uniref:putative transmembrane protein 244 n=1 Tax=Lineus longissimus TaxID=88925 RepID=UPI002B4EBDBC